MNKEAEIIAQLQYWHLITDYKAAKNLLLRLRLMDKADFGRAYYRLKEIRAEEDKANALYKAAKEEGLEI